MHRRSAAKRVRIIISLSGARVRNNFFGLNTERERASPARFHAAAARFTTREQSACSKFGRGSDRMTHNASAAAAAGAATGERSEKGFDNDAGPCNNSLIQQQEGEGGGREFKCVCSSRVLIFMTSSTMNETNYAKLHCNSSH